MNFEHKLRFYRDQWRVYRDCNDTAMLRKWRKFSNERYDVYREFRENDPVHCVESPGVGRRWYVFRFAEAEAVLRDHDGFDRIGVMPPYPPGAFRRGEQAKRGHDKRRPTIRHDDHNASKFKRSCFNRLFSNAITSDFEARIENICHALIDDMVTHDDPDLATQYAMTIPFAAIAEMVGFPRSDWGFLRDTTLAFSSRLDLDITAESLLKTRKAADDMAAYVNTRISERRMRADGSSSALIWATFNNEFPDQADAMCAQALSDLILTNEFTGYAIANTLFLLLTAATTADHPSVAEAAVSPAGIEECLRFDSPSQATPRCATRNQVIGGRHIAAGELVVVVLGSANRDPHRFAKPDEWRPTADPVRNLAFGFGQHFCLGAKHARLQIQIAVKTILKRLPNIRLAATPPTKIQGLNRSGFHRLPIAF